MTKEYFINKSNLIHKEQYDYLLIKNTFYSREKVDIFCKHHGIFKQYAHHHINGVGCPKCGFIKSHKNTKDNKELFIEKSLKKHGNKYVYDKVEYINSRTKVKIICQSHGEFFINPSMHIFGSGCKKCSIDKNIKKTNFYNGVNIKESFICKSNEIHNNLYCYDFIEYKNINTKIIINCLKHGNFKQTPKSHLSGNGCPNCALELKSTKQRKNFYDIINIFNTTHNNKYDYSKSIYKNNKIKIEIICKKHGSFWQSTSHHLNGSGCPECKNSLGENKINCFLKDNKINFEFQKKFDNCKNINKLPFDFYLPDYNVCIEYDGKQHFEPLEIFGGLKAFLKLKINDKIKNDFCKNNNIILFRVKYSDNIMKEMKKILKYLEFEL